MGVPSRTFANGIVYLLRTHDGYPLEVTDTFLPFYTKDAIGRKQNTLEEKYYLGDRRERLDRRQHHASDFPPCSY